MCREFGSNFGMVAHPVFQELNLYSESPGSGKGQDQMNEGGVHKGAMTQLPGTLVCRQWWQPCPPEIESVG